MGDRGLRHDAVPEIEDEWAAAKGFDYRVDRTVERGPADDERERIEIALDRQARLNAILSKFAIDHPVEPDRVYCGTFPLTGNHRAGSPREANDLYALRPAQPTFR